MEILKIASRSITRNRKRSLLTITMIFFGIAFSILGMSWFNGISKNLLEAGTKVTGEIRITAKDYDIKEKTMDLSSNIELKEIEKRLANDKNIKNSFGKIKFGGVIFKEEDIQKEALGFGISEKEDKITELNKYIYEGKFLNFKNKREIIIGEKIKRYLNLKLGDEVTILTRTPDNSMTAFNYKIVGFYKLDNGKLNQSFYITLTDAWELLDMDGMANEYLVYLNTPESSKQYKKAVYPKLQDKYAVKSWEEIGMNGTISTIIPVVKIIIVVIFAILGGVGVANTMLMVVFERKKEIGVMKAVGTENKDIFMMLTLEGTLLGVIGAVSGAVIGTTIAFIVSRIGINIAVIEEGMPSGITLKGVIYPQVEIIAVMGAVAAGVIISFLATIIPVAKTVKKEPSELMM